MYCIFAKIFYFNLYTLTNIYAYILLVFGMLATVVFHVSAFVYTNAQGILLFAILYNFLNLHYFLYEAITRVREFNLDHFGLCSFLVSFVLYISKSLVIKSAYIRVSILFTYIYFKRCTIFFFYPFYLAIT